MSNHSPLFLSLLLVIVGALGACGDNGGSSSMSGETDPNAGAVVSYKDDAGSIESGRAIFDAQVCSRCHKETGVPGIGPNLWDDEWLYGNKPDEIFESIMHGRPRGMSPYQGQLSAQEVWHIVAYLRSATQSKR